MPHVGLILMNQPRLNQFAAVNDPAPLSRANPRAFAALLSADHINCAGSI